MTKKLFFGACALAGAGIMSASNPADTAAIKLRTVEVSANRADRRTPVAFTNVSKEQLLRANDGRDMTYLLSATPSVVSTSDAGMGMGYTSMRVRGTDATRINVMANGVPINDSESGAVFWVNMPDLASSVRDVQIQRGAGTSANGGAAFGASVNMITDAPDETPYAEVSGSFGSYNTNRQTLRVGSGLLCNHWSFDARLSHMGSDGYIDRASSKLWSYFGQAAYSNPGTLIRFIAFGGKERTYMAWDYASREQMEQFGRRYNPCGEYTDSLTGKTAYYPNQYDHFTQHHFQIHLAQRLADKWNLNVALHYTDDYGYYEQLKTNKKVKEYGLTGETFASKNKSDIIRLKYNDNGFGGALANVSYRNGGLDLTFGGAINYFKGHHFGQIAWVRNYVGAINPLQNYYDNTGRKLDGNVYARANYSFGNGFSAFGDLQYRGVHYTIDGASDNWNDRLDAMDPLDVDKRWDFFNPKFGLNYDKGPHRAFASWSVAHKEPVRSNFTDGYNPQEPPRAERLFDYELGYTFNHPIISAGLNLYYMDYKDQLVLNGQLSDTGNPLSVNVPRSYRMGIELQAAFRPWCDWFEWTASATLSRNRIKNFTQYVYNWGEDDGSDILTFHYSDTPIAFSPSLIFNNSFNFTFKGLQATVRTQYVGKQFMDNTGAEAVKLKAYCTTDLLLNYTLPRLSGIKEWTVGLGIYNLFNAEYENNGYASAYYDGYSDPTRSVQYWTGYSAQAPIHAMGTLTFKF